MKTTKKAPTVRLASPKSRPIQLRYTDPETRREVRISTGTTNEAEAAEQKAKLEAKLLLGIDAKPRHRVRAGASMPWDDFRDQYTELHLSTLRPKSARCAESRLDIAERIMKPRTLGDMATTEALTLLQQKLLDGAEAKNNRPRAKTTAKNYLVLVLAALGWAAEQGWLPAVPRVRKLKTAKLKQMKGRPITLAEFKAMIEATSDVVGAAAAPSWRYLLRGLWTSGLRLDELLHVHWTDGEFIVPEWPAGELPILAIPAPMQKNDTEESIPLLPEFEEILLKTPADQRAGWAFNPLSLAGKVGRKSRSERLQVGWVGKIISDIGEKAGIVVQAATQKKPCKYASAHDLRRSLADRLADADVSERELGAVMRHVSVETTRRHYAPGKVQRSASLIRKRLAAVPGYSEPADLT